MGAARASLAPLAGSVERASPAVTTRRRWSDDESTGRMFLTRASAVATRSNRPPRRAFSTRPTRPARNRPPPRRHVISYRRTLLTEHGRRPYCYYCIVFVVVIFSSIDEAPVRPLPVTRTSPFSLRSHRAATADFREDRSQRSSTNPSARNFTVAVLACHYHHHHHRNRCASRR